jgi:phage shock protein E
VHANQGAFSHIASCTHIIVLCQNFIRMLGKWIKKLLGMPDADLLQSYKEKGAVVIDVRTKGEFQSGHGKNAKNVPLDQIAAQAGKIKAMNKPIIVCCRSGARSGQAAGILKSKGIDVVNGGPWQNVADF